MYFRKKPVVIEAIQWDGDPKTHDAIAKWTAVRKAPDNDYDLIIPTLEGDHRALLNDWVIKGVKGECYPCKSDIFVLTYEPASQP